MSEIYPLSLNGDTFNGLKADFDIMLRQLLTEMEKHEAEDGTITIKVGVKLEKDQARDFQANGYDAMRDIVKPSFKHDISTVMQIKDKKTGSVGGSMEMVWDRELCQYVMRPIDNGQVSIFDAVENMDDEEDESEGNILPALLGPSGTVVHADPKVLFEYMKQFVGAEMRVLEAARQYTVRTLDNKVVLSSACQPTDRFYCSPEKLAPHVGHSIICIGSPSDEEQFESISIWCEDCDESIFELRSPDLSGDDESVDSCDDFPDEDGSDNV